MRCEPTPASPTFIALHLGLCSLAWGSSFLLIKLMQGDVPPLVLAAGRGFFGAVTLILCSLLQGQNPLPRRIDIVPWLIIGALNGFIPNILVAIGLTKLDSGPAALLQSAGPLLTAIGAHFLFVEERLTRNSLTGILLGLIGVGFLIGPRALEGSATLQGMLAMLGVAACYAAGNLYTRYVSTDISERFALGQQVASGLMSSVIAFTLMGSSAITPIARHLGPMLALGVFATAFPMVLFMRLIRRVGPTRASLTGYTVPTVAAILGITVLNESLGIMQILGGIIVFTGVYLVALSKRKPA